VGGEERPERRGADGRTDMTALLVLTGNRTRPQRSGGPRRGCAWPRRA